MLFKHCTFCARFLEFSVLNEGLFSTLNEVFRSISDVFFTLKIIELG